MMGMDIFGQRVKESNKILSHLPLAYARLSIIFNEKEVPVDLSIDDINPEYEKISGIDRKNLVDKRVSEVFPDLLSSMPTLFDRYFENLQQSNQFTFEYFARYQKRWYDIYVRSITRSELIIVFDECTKRKRMEEQLKSSENKFKSLFNNSTVGIYRTTPDGKILMANQSLISILGYSSFEELAKINLENDGYHLGFRRKDFIKSIESKNEVKGYESCWKTKNGGHIFVRESAHVVRDEKGNIKYYEGTVEDITANKTARLQISKLNTLYSDLGIDPEQNIKIILNKAGDILQGELAFCMINDKEKLIHTWANNPDKDDKIQTIKLAEKLNDEIINNGQTSTFLVKDLWENYKLNGISTDTDISLRSCIGCVIKIDDQPVGSLCVFHSHSQDFSDTEQKIITTLCKALSLEYKRYLLEKNLKNAIAEAKNANKAKSQFLANMSHEIRTPLNGIMGFSEMLKYQEEDENRKRMLNMIEESGHQLLQIINDIFEYSKIEAGKIKQNLQNFNLAQTVRDTVKIFEKPAENKGLQLVIDTENLEIEFLFGDTYKLQQILANLVSNAIKFTDEGVIIVAVKSFNRGDGVQCDLVIEDTGIGIDKAHLDKIFDEFHQLEFYLTKKIKGTGLGLTIAKKLIETMGGSMKVESQTGKGSRFYLTIPFEPAKNVKSESIMSSMTENSDPMNGKVKILLAEDNEANQFLIKAITKTKNWDIAVVDNGQKAVEKFRDDHFDLVLMDVQMPVMNGYEATREIRVIEKEKGTYTPIIALTAYAMKSDKDLCIEAGMDDYISKPFKRQQFLETIINQLNKKK